MVVARVSRSRARRLAAACTLSAAALAGISACGGAAEAVQPTQQPTPPIAASPDVASSSPSTVAGTTTAVTTSTTATTTKAEAAPACGNHDLRVTWGYGTQSTPSQAAAIVFTNVSDHTCTLRGYPGLSIKDGNTLINATRVLNGFRGDQPPLSSPPLVTLAPKDTSYAVVQWSLSHGQTCYASGTGEFEATPPNTTDTVVLSNGVTIGGRNGICSGLEINPVVPGVFGAKVV